MNYSNGTRILIVEEEARIALVLSRALDILFQGQCLVDVTPVAEAALDKVCNEAVDLVIADLHAPTMGGLELIRHIRQAKPQTRTILMATFCVPQIEKQVQELGIILLLKPFSLKDLLAHVQRVLSTEVPGPGAWQRESSRKTSVLPAKLAGGRDSLVERLDKVSVNEAWERKIIKRLNGLYKMFCPVKRQANITWTNVF